MLYISMVWQNRHVKIGRDKSDDRHSIVIALIKKGLFLLDPVTVAGRRPKVQYWGCLFLERIVMIRFRPHRREKKNVSDTGRIGHKHEKTVKPDAESTCRGHTVFQSSKEVFTEGCASSSPCSLSSTCISKRAL